jgi:hypothetical protein
MAAACFQSQVITTQRRASATHRLAKARKSAVVIGGKSISGPSRSLADRAPLCVAPE